MEVLRILYGIVVLMLGVGLFGLTYPQQNDKLFG